MISIYMYTSYISIFRTIETIAVVKYYCHYYNMYFCHLTIMIAWAPIALWIRELTLYPLGFSPSWFEPCLAHFWESQVLLTDGQVVFPQVLQFSPTFDEQLTGYK